jgi:hypothetical protein
MRLETEVAPQTRVLGECAPGHPLQRENTHQVADARPATHEVEESLQASTPERRRLEWFKVEPLPMPSLGPLSLATMPEFVPPKLPTVSSFFGTEATQTWLGTPGIEIALEATFIDGLDVAAMPAEARLLPLEIVKDNEKQSAKVGRQHQQEWFESKLDPSNVNCISRSAFEIMWSRPDDFSGNVFALQVLGNSFVHVNNLPIQPGQLCPLLPNACITLCSQDSVPLVTFTSHFNMSTAKQTARPCDVNLPKLLSLTNPKRHEQEERLREDTWCLMLDYTNGLSKEDVQALLAKDILMAVPLEEQGSQFLVGRQHQFDMFAALLRGAPQLLQLVSRSHFKLEKQEDMTLLLTNLSHASVLIDDLSVVRCGETSLLQDGQKIQFTANDNSPFLSFCVVAPRLARSNKLQHPRPCETVVTPLREGTESSGTNLIGDMPQQLDQLSWQANKLQESPSTDNVGFLEECGAALLDTSFQADSRQVATSMPSPAVKVKNLTPNAKILRSPPTPMSDPPKCGCFIRLPCRWKQSGS